MYERDARRPRRIFEDHRPVLLQWGLSGAQRFQRVLGGRDGTEPPAATSATPVTSTPTTDIATRALPTLDIVVPPPAPRTDPPAPAVRPRPRGARDPAATGSEGPRTDAAPATEPATEPATRPATHPAGAARAGMTLTSNGSNAWPDRLARLATTLCQASDPAFENWSVTVPLDPRVLPETELAMSLLRQQLTLCFRTQSPRSAALVQDHRALLHDLVTNSLQSQRLPGPPPSVAIDLA